MLRPRGIHSMRPSFPNARHANFRVAGMATGVAVGLAMGCSMVLNDAPQEKDNKKQELTREQQFYIDSQKQTESRKLPDYEGSSNKLYVFGRRLLTRLEVWIWDPIATTFRFFYLSLLFTPVLLTLPIILIGPRDKSKDNERYTAIWWYGLLTKMMERAGASFIKLGQWAASRTDIFPPQLCAEMSDLHSNNKAHSLRVTKRTLEGAFDMPFEEIFDEFVDKPLGVGAIAQVYKGKLSQKALNSTKQKAGERSPSGWVAIKVLHPRVSQIVERDLSIMRFFANIINALPTMEWLSLPGEVEQFAGMMRLQMDLQIEGKNLEVFNKNFADKADVHFPHAFLEFTTRDVLVEEYIDAIPVHLFLERAKNGGGFDKEIANKGLDAFLQMLLIDNFIHADLHPGNIFVRLYKPESTMHHLGFGDHNNANEDYIEMQKVNDHLKSLKHDPKAWDKEVERLKADGYHAQLCMIDAGLVTELNDLNRRNFIDLFKALAEFDGYKAGDLMVQRSRTPETVIDPETYALKVGKLVSQMKSRTFKLGNFKIGDLLTQVLAMVRQHHVRMEPDFITVILSILLLEGIGRQLNPDLDLFKNAIPVLRELGTHSGDGRALFSNEDMMSMLKVWLALETRQFISASVAEVNEQVKYDGLCPNV
ncbi:ABC1 family protein [Yarrowia sp. C11]|nr:ABC1 family protein [Yarrowia sp. C11]KAG5371164.1 ABC1 family protein [Yarrowia sp. E02]